MFQIKKRIVNKGTGFARPALTSKCQVTICTDPVDPKFSELFGVCLNAQSDFTFAHPLKYCDSILAECVKTMKLGELAHFDVNFTAVDAGKEDSMKLVIQLHYLTEGKRSHELSAEEKMTLAGEWKNLANSLFSKGEICMAGYWYSEALCLLISCSTDDIGGTDIYRDLVCNCRNNLAAVQLRRSLYDHVVSNCTSALNIKPHLVKALYRRAQAYIAKNDKILANKDLRLALKLEPKSQAVRKLLGAIIRDSGEEVP